MERNTRVRVERQVLVRAEESGKETHVGIYGFYRPAARKATSRATETEKGEGRFQRRRGSCQTKATETIGGGTTDGHRRECV
ncbi:hypothetical protein PC117_g10970 [Phytophthora cactorum]|uniref:Uncharacterized protein n=1 Tax=Phytophthora cactorum TaxID=29920 RepID=A0A8T1DI15_9STRA|nr:hypothetical protein PC117_g10970 [Phytophthora cactorum]